MNIVAKFEKVSFEQFKKDWLEKNPTTKTNWSEEEIKEIYDNIILPKRGTVGSAGYDIYAPTDIRLPYGNDCVVPTGLRCKIKDSWFLDINPRSGHGFKLGISLANTRGIIDTDYYGADNEGHIMVKIVNNNHAVNYLEKPFMMENGKAFCQGIFTIYGITEDDATTEERTGGFGSTDKK